MNLSSKIEAVLFYKGEPVSISKLASILETDETSIKEAIGDLKEKLNGRGVSLVEKEDEIMLGTKPELSSLIEKIAKEELSKDIGKAGLETLSIVLYKGPISRSEVDYIRGVNSSFIVRNLLIRGLIERVQNKNDSRSYLYKPSFDLLSLLGVEKIDDLPDRDRVLQNIENFQKQNDSETELNKNEE